jgi:exopolysaccharide biosynthesis polyprenyl glycosylphosphotransferase
LRSWYASPRIAIPLIIFGFNPLARYLIDQLLEGPTHYEPVGFVGEGAAGQQYRGYPLVASLSDLVDLREALPSLEVAVATPDASRVEQEQIIKFCERNNIRWWVVPWMVNSLAGGFKVDLLGTVPLIGPSGSSIAGLNFVLKRALDVVASAVLLVVLAPLMALAAILILVMDGAPVLFRQTRIGMHGQTFQLLKFRTMYCDAGDQAHREYVRRWIRGGAAPSNQPDQVAEVNELFKLADDVRVTPIGRLLRRFSIDELPQLVNVLCGEMSLIGPRPALPYELDLYEEWHRRRLAAAPGITGLWQVSGRNRLSFSEMVRLDLQYLEDWSFAGDLRILARTVTVLMRGSGV